MDSLGPLSTYTSVALRVVASAVGVAPQVIKFRSRLNCLVKIYISAVRLKVCRRRAEVLLIPGAVAWCSGAVTLDQLQMSLRVWKQ